jgi:hypothetical protein
VRTKAFHCALAFVLAGMGYYGASSAAGTAVREVTASEAATVRGSVCFVNIGCQPVGCEQHCSDDPHHTCTKNTTRLYNTASSSGGFKLGTAFCTDEVCDYMVLTTAACN